MGYSEEEIKNQIKAYIDSAGGDYSKWYVGITNNPQRRLFDEHNVMMNNSRWVRRTASSHEVARRIEAYFIDELGLDGGTGGGDEDSTVVYAYKKTPTTKP